MRKSIPCQLWANMVTDICYNKIMKKIYGFSFLIGFVLNSLFIFLPYFFTGESSLIKVYLEASTMEKIFFIAFPYIVLNFLIVAFSLFFYKKNRKKDSLTLVSISLSILWNLIGFFLPIIFVFCIEHGIWTGATLP